MSFSLEYNEFTHAFDRQLPNVITDDNLRNDLFYTLRETEKIYNEAMQPFNSKTNRYALLKYTGYVLASCTVIVMILLFALANPDNHAIVGVSLACLGGVFLFLPVIITNRAQNRVRQRVKHDIVSILEEANQTKFDNKIVKLYMDANSKKKPAINIVVQGIRSMDFKVYYDRREQAFNMHLEELPSTIDVQAVSHAIANLSDSYRESLSAFHAFHKVFLAMQGAGWFTIFLSFVLTFTTSYDRTQLVLGTLTMLMGSTCTLVGFYLMNRISEKTMVTARSTLISHMERENEQLENIQGVIKEHVLEETQSKMIEFISHPFIQFVVWNTANTSTEIIEL